MTFGHLYANLSPLILYELLEGGDHGLLVIISFNKETGSFKIQALGKQILLIFLASDVICIRRNTEDSKEPTDTLFNFL